MCYLCHCFGWTLDLIQRTITFALACCLGLAVCFGLSVAIIAGIAYGYNYCKAEFLTLGRSDVTMNRRRDQFPENPHDTLLRNFKASDDNLDYFSQNITSEYDEMTDRNSNLKSLSDIWAKNQETRKYAEKLTKYSLIDKTPWKNRPVEEKTIKYNMSTTLLQSGSSQILMREFQPDDIALSHSYKTRAPEEPVDDALPRNTIKFPILGDNVNLRNTLIAGIDIKENFPSERNTILFVPEHLTRRTDLSKRPLIPMLHWGTSEYPVIADYSVNQQDDYDIVYKPV